MKDYKELISKAIEAREHSYSPYSKFRVGSAILCENGSIYTGCNVENASFGETVCAERIAIFKAISNGEHNFAAIAIVGGLDQITDYTYPCGSCRQVLSEHCAKELDVVLFDGENIKLCTLGELFPSSFKKDVTKKKNGIPLNSDEIKFTIDGYMSGNVADYQMSALLMAICLKGMDKDETFYLTKTMLESGEQVDLSVFGKLSVDKHSTGGVGDKTTLIVAPIVASLGCKVAKMSGRGLGFTGGTVDKLESLTGYNVTQNPHEFLGQVQKIGVSVVGQSGNLAPADKKLYALRDVTATIDSIPLIASSIMSKKLASGSYNIVLDVKCGSGAFMKTPSDALELAKAMVEIGQSFGRNIRALVTNMDLPLGYAVGNRTEVWEAIQVLIGKGEQRLHEICVSLATNIVSISLNIDTCDAKAMVEDAISSGKALAKMREWIECQGGDVSYIDNAEKLLGAKYKFEYVAKKGGYITKMQADAIGKASMLLGAGRVKLGDTIDYDAGIIFKKSYGDDVNIGDTIATLYSNTNSFDACVKELDSAVIITAEKPHSQKLIFDVV